MKVTLKYFSHSPNINDYLLPRHDGLHSIKNEQPPTSSQPGNRIELHDKPWFTARPDTNSTWNSTLPDSFAPTKQHRSDTCSLNGTKHQ